MRALDLGYLAGILDGEGCITFSVHRRRGGTLRAVWRIEVGSTTPEVLTWLVEHVGGGICPDPRPRPRFRPCPYWYIDGEKAVKLARVVGPHLVVKAAQAALLIDTWGPAPWERRQEWHRRFRILNRRGA